MANLVDGEPDGRKRAEPEDEERSVIGRGGTGILREGIGDGIAVLEAVSWMDPGNRRQLSNTHPR